MRRWHSPRDGFTLIELIVSLAIGLIIVSALYAGFRATMQTMSYSLILSNENAILRHGFVTLLDEADHWTVYDQPEAALPPGLERPDPSEPVTAGIGNRATADVRARIPTGVLMGVTLDRVGGPFTPVAALRTATCLATGNAGQIDPWTNGRPVEPKLVRDGSLPSIPADALTRPQEFERGWDGDGHWAAADSRTWSWANQIEAQSDTFGDQRYGFYALFSSPFTQVMLDEHTIGGATLPAFGTIRPMHHWLPNQVSILRGVMGEYGMAEYLPSNSVPLFYGAVLRTGPGTLTVYPRMPSHILNDKVTRGMPANTYYTKSQYPADGFLATIHSGTSSGSMSVHSWGIHGNNMIFGGTRNEQRSLFMFDFHRVVRPLFFQKPESWPDVHYEYMRYSGPGRFNSLASLSWSGITQQKPTRVYLNLFGTSLRGARQQRHRDGGWATWLLDGGEARTRTLQYQDGAVGTQVWYHRVWSGVPGAPGSQVLGYVLKRDAAAGPRDQKMDPVVDLGLPAGFRIPVTGNDPTLDDY